MIGDWFSAYGDMYGYGAQQQNPNPSWNCNGLQQAANAYNNQYSGAYERMLRQWESNSVRQPPVIEARKADCEGCGAPLKSYTHHCEYCRRAI